jgi:hypothetical protein
VPGVLERFLHLLSGRGPRTTGRPPSANGASSLHLRWHTTGEFRSASVTLEVLEAPVVPRLYFWALQVDLCDAAERPGGGAHLGLQWHPSHPGSTAVNWGGYRPGGGELDGSPSALRSATSNPNTRDLAWSEGVPYRLSVEPSPTAGPSDTLTAWRGSVTDPTSGRTIVVRDLYAPGDRIRGLVVWSEVFARCDDPTVVVRWSDPVCVTPDGRRVEPESVSVSYQSHADGGCANTDATPDGAGVLQRTAAPRGTPQGASLPVR